MKRALLIAGGAVGSLGAVFAITPPQFSSNDSTLGAGVGNLPSATTSPSASAKPAATQSSAATKKPTATPTKKSTAAATQSPTPTAATTKSASPTPTAAATSNKATSGTFTGDLSSVGPYGGVVIRVTIAGGKITDVQAVQAPGGQNQRYTDRAVPTMRQRTIAAQSANITGVSGASYTSYNFYKSLTSALSKAGWM